MRAPQYPTSSCPGTYAAARAAAGASPMTTAIAATRSGTRARRRMSMVLVTIGRGIGALLCLDSAGAPKFPCAHGTFDVVGPMSSHFFPRDEYFMRLALREAALALEHDDVPVGAVIVREGEVIGLGHNEREVRSD